MQARFEAPGSRIAVVGLLDSEERDKLALILAGVQQAGHTPILIDAELVAAGQARFDRGPSGARLSVAGKAGVAIVDGIRGWHRSVTGAGERVVVDGITVVAREPYRPLASTWARVRAGTVRPTTMSIPVDAVWPEALDITRRLEFERLYRGLAEHRIPTLAGSWGSVLTTMLKHRLRETLDRVAVDVPQPRAVVLDAAMREADIQRAREQFSGGVWLKAPNDTHGRGVAWLPAGEKAAAAARAVMRDTPDGTLCLMEEDVCGIVEDPGGRQYRADLAVTVLDNRVLQATLRVQPRRAHPTNSSHGGRSVAITPSTLPDDVRRIAVRAVSATGSRYGSTDILGGLVSTGGYTVVRSPRPVVCEVNVMPGGRSPGFLSLVTLPLVAAYVDASREASTPA
jgi:hypothetical protein